VGGAAAPAVNPHPSKETKITTEISTMARFGPFGRRKPWRMIDVHGGRRSGREASAPQLRADRVTPR
jgi:hypothetical protein